jgi:hypothetical protein
VRQRINEAEIDELGSNSRIGRFQEEAEAPLKPPTVLSAMRDQITSFVGPGLRILAELFSELIVDLAIHDPGHFLGGRHLSPSNGQILVRVTIGNTRALWTTRSWLD